MKVVPESLFGRLLAAMLAAIGVTLVIVVGLLLQERRESLFSRSDSAAVVTAIAETAKALAAMPELERAEEIARLRREPLLPGSRPLPWREREDIGASVRQLRSRLARALGASYAVDVMPARPGPTDAIGVGASREPLSDRPPPRGPDGPEARRDGFRGPGSAGGF